MKVLIACEYSGAMRDAFIARGHEALSCDLLPTDVPGPHYQGDVFDIINDGWDLMIAHPPCTYLSSSGLHWNKNPKSPRFGGAQTEEALLFVRRLLAADIPRIALENPSGCIGTRIRPASQFVQPYDYGDDASKKTGLWLKGLPLLKADAAHRVAGRRASRGWTPRGMARRFGEDHRTMGQPDRLGAEQAGPFRGSPEAPKRNLSGPGTGRCRTVGMTCP